MTRGLEDTQPDEVADAPGPDAPDFGPLAASIPTTATGAIAGWLAADETFVETFPGGLYYAAAPAGVDSPYVVFGLESTQVDGLAGRPMWSEWAAYKFEVWDSGDTADGSEVADAAETLSAILFGVRGAAQDPIEFAGGRVVRRRVMVSEIGIAPGMGRGGADMFRATIEATILIARDG